MDVPAFLSTHGTLYVFAYTDIQCRRLHTSWLGKQIENYLRITLFISTIITESDHTKQNSMSTRNII